MMSELLRKASSLSVAGLMMTGVAFASSAENVETGADSDNTNEIDVTQDIEDDVDNDASIDNVGVASASTGGNSSDENTGGGDVDSGDADIEADLENLVNTLEAYFSGEFGEVDWDLLNSITGSDSSNLNDLFVSQSIDLDIENDATLLNILDLLAASGDNSADENTGGGEVDTGDALAMADILNELNLAGVSDDVEFGDVDVSGTNEQTGADSDNTNEIDVDQDFTYEADNTADVENTVVTSASTGGNSSSMNTGGGDVSTGDAESGATVANSINQGSGSGSVEFSDIDVDVSNDTTGFSSDNLNDVDIDQDVDVDVENDATVENVVDADSSTGDNSADENTGGGEVSTGDATITINISNTVN